jgi:CubicO group peptidase (beta-lactamase class C family)
MLVRSGRLWRYLFCLLLLLLQPGIVRSALAAPARPAVDVARIDAFVRAQMGENHLPGVALALVHGDRIVHLRGFGEAARDGRAVTPQTPFVLGSVSKSLTALAIMQLVEAGKVALDAPVTRYLPWFQLSDANASRRITVRQLLSHTSGIPDSAGISGTTLSALRTTSPEQLVRSFRTVAMDRPVGSRFEYSDANYIVVGLIVQVVSGESFGDYLQHHIFAPLHMRQSFTSEQEARQHGLAQGFTSWFGVPWPIEEPYLPVNLAAGYTISSAEDMAHFLVAQMNGGRYGQAAILSPAGIAAMHTPSEPGLSYGMGWFVGSIDGTPAYWHDGVTFRFHAYELIEPRQRWGAVLLLNLQSAIASPAISHLQAGIAALLSGREPPPAGMSMRTLALIVDGVLLLVLTAAVSPLLRLPRWYRRKQGRRFGILTRVRLAAELLLPAALVAGPPLLGQPWSDLFVVFPDYTTWFLTLLGVIFLTGCARGLLMIVLLRRTEPRVQRASAQGDISVGGAPTTYVNTLAGGEAAFVARQPVDERRHLLRPTRAAHGDAADHVVNGLL